MSTTKTPLIFWIVSIIALLWNAFGCFQWFIEYGYYTNPASRDELPEMMRDMYDYTPSWLYIVFAIAVVTGLIGSILLIMKKKVAVPVFLVSIIAIIAMDIHNLFLSGLLQAKGPSILIMPLIVLLFAIFLYFFARHWRDKGLLV